jgi:hypothetical protein
VQRDRSFRGVDGKTPAVMVGAWRHPVPVSKEALE